MTENTQRLESLLLRLLAGLRNVKVRFHLLYVRKSTKNFYKSAIFFKILRYRPQCHFRI